MSSGLRSDVQNHIAKDFVVLRTPSPHPGSARSASLRDLPSRWCKIMPIAVTECILDHISGPVSHLLGKVDELMCSVEEDMEGLVSSRDPLLLEQMINRHAFVLLV